MHDVPFECYETLGHIFLNAKVGIDIVHFLRMHFFLHIFYLPALCCMFIQADVRSLSRPEFTNKKAARCDF